MLSSITACGTKSSVETKNCDQSMRVQYFFDTLFSHMLLIYVTQLFVFGASILQDKDLAQYSPSHSNTSKHIPCNHELCEMGSVCESPKGHCPYTAYYQTEDTSSSGFLFEDLLHLATIGENKQQSSVHASIIIGYAVCLLQINSHNSQTKIRFPISP